MTQYEYLLDTYSDGEARTYVYYFNEDYYYEEYGNASISFEIIPFSGNPDMYVNYGKQPFVLQANRWSSREEGIEKITIDRADLKADLILREEEVYYVTVTGDGSAAYVIIVRVEIGKSWIDFNIPTSGELKKGSLFLYDLTTTSKENLNITLDVQNPLGHVDVYIKRCISEDCTVSMDDINGRDKLLNQST